MFLIGLENKMKLFKAHFEPMQVFEGSGGGLVILARSFQDAADIASETIMHVSAFSLEEIPMDKPRVVFYNDGDY
jgi:hypothetical protein